MVRNRTILFIDMFSEGSKTEPVYIRDFSDKYTNGKVKIGVQFFNTSIIELVYSAIEQSKLWKTKRESTRSIWLLFDKDNVSDVEVIDIYNNIDTYNKSCKYTHQKIHIAFSNSCIEIWALAHFMARGPFPNTSIGCQTKLKNEFMPNYDHGRGRPFLDINLMDENKYQKAKKMAQSWKATAETPNDCPYTDIYELLEKIKSI